MNPNVNYAAMTLQVFVRTLARLMFSPMAIAGKVRMVFQHGPRAYGKPMSLSHAMDVHRVAAVGDTAAETQMRGWIRMIQARGGGHVGGGAGTRLLLQEADWTLGKQYMGISIS
jgi:hypothetical protein